MTSRLILPPRFSRRTVVAGAMAGGSAALLGIGARASGLPAADPFTLGVASGEPVPDGMVLWTRLAPEPLAADGGMPARAVPVRWEVADDDRFVRIIRSGEARAEPEWGHCVHVEVSGLKPGRPYFYRFQAAGHVSATGRTRTAPAPGDRVDRLRFAYGSCQKYEAGFYAAYRHMVAEEPDLILFLGDYIYEGNPDSGPQVVRQHLNREPMDIAGYRIRYATYRRDPLLQAAHAAAPWAVIWDDHEVANDYAADIDQRNSDPAVFLQRRAAAYHVYWEHMPLRRSARPDGAAMRLYRSLAWGDLAQFQLVDDRQYRSPRACQPAEARVRGKKYQGAILDCPERSDPRQSILGFEQEAWLRGAFDRSRATWNLLAQQTLMTQIARIDAEHPDLGPRYYAADKWEGYAASRTRIQRHWRDAGTANPLVLSGDIHCFVAADMPDPDRPDAPPVASEFVGGSITSLSHDLMLKANMAANRGFRFGEHLVRGYGSGVLTQQGCDIAFRGLADARDPDSAIRTIAAFHVEPGVRGMHVTA
ncbi:MAG: alkaline phosphatase D family protein [Pseudomonadota bacterium]